MINQFKCILFDLDNTLYEYDPCNNYALEVVFKEISKNHKVSHDDLHKLYNFSRSEVKKSIPYQASSHSRLLYLKTLLEKISNPVNPCLVIQYEKIYWDAFFNKMSLFEGVVDCLKYLQANNIKVGLITDLNLRIQLKKIDKLNIFKYFHKIVTSEEVGIEKPSPIIFEHMLKSLGVLSSEACMVGDNLERDIKGADRLGIYTILKSNKVSSDMHVKETFNDFKELKNIFEKII